VPLPFDPDGDPVSLVAIGAAGLDQAIWASDVATGGFRLQTSVSAGASFRRADGTSPVSLVVTVKDPWRSANVPVALQISNRAPIPTLFAAAPLVSYAGNAYVARANVAQFVDEDGDPIDGVQGSGDPACVNFMVTGGVVAATCSRAFDWTTGAFPPLSSFASAPLSVSVSVSDPWQRSATVSTKVTPTTPPPPVILSGGFGPSATCTCKCIAPTDCSELAPCVTSDFVPDMATGGLPVNMKVLFPDGTSKVVDCLGGNCSAPVPVRLCQAPTSLIVTLSNGITTTTPQIVTGSVSCSNAPCAGGGGGGGVICRFPPCHLPP
jgi:hypothetical protein